MQDDMEFDNLYIGKDLETARAFAQATWKLKAAQEGKKAGVEKSFFGGIADFISEVVIVIETGVVLAFFFSFSFLPLITAPNCHRNHWFNWCDHFAVRCQHLLGQTRRP